MLARKKRIGISGSIIDFLNNIKALPGITSIEISPEIAVCATELESPFHNDPADRMIVATAICSDAVLITRDRKIIEWSNVNEIEVIVAW